LIGAGGERVTVGAPGSGLFWTKFKPWKRRAATPDEKLSPDGRAFPRAPGRLRIVLVTFGC
jgi:hypothetical protein